MYIILISCSWVCVWILQWHTSLVLDNQQVKRIIEMAQLCISADQHIRPTIDEFINKLNEKETVTTVVSPLCGHSRSNSGSSLEQVWAFIAYNFFSREKCLLESLFVQDPNSRFQNLYMLQLCSDTLQFLRICTWSVHFA